MSKIAVIIDQDFEDSEYQQPVDALKKAGHQTVNVGITQGQEVSGKSGKAKAHIDRAVADVSVDDFDALFIPGGYSPDHLRINDDAVAFARDFVKSEKPVFAICHAPQLLINAQVLKGRRITGWKSIIQDIKNAGADFVDGEVVEDRNIISSRSPKDIPAFNNRIVDRLRRHTSKGGQPEDDNGTPSWDQPESGTRR